MLLKDSYQTMIFTNKTEKGAAIISKSENLMYNMKKKNAIYMVNRKENHYNELVYTLKMAALLKLMISYIVSNVRNFIIHN